MTPDLPSTSIAPDPKSRDTVPGEAMSTTEITTTTVSFRATCPVCRSTVAGLATSDEAVAAALACCGAAS